MREQNRRVGSMYRQGWERFERPMPLLQEEHRRTHPARLHREDEADGTGAGELVEDLMAALDVEGADEEDATETDSAAEGPSRAP